VPGVELAWPSELKPQPTILLSLLMTASTNNASGMEFRVSNSSGGNGGSEAIIHVLKTAKKNRVFFTLALLEFTAFHTN